MRTTQNIGSTLMVLLVWVVLSAGVSTAWAQDSDVSALHLSNDGVALQTLGSKAPLNARLAGRLLKLANQARAEQGLAPLKLHGGLTRVALQNGSELAGEGLGSQSMSERRQKAGVIAGLAGQTLFVSSGIEGEELAQTVLRTWLVSPQDRSTLLDPRATHIGVAVVDGGHRTGVVAVFAGKLK